MESIKIYSLEMIEKEDRVFFESGKSDPLTRNLISIRFNKSGEGHASRQEALEHLKSVEEFDMRARLAIG